MSLALAGTTFQRAAWHGLVRRSGEAAIGELIGGTENEDTVMRSFVWFLSGLCVLALSAHVEAFVISEINYHPPTGQENLEFIELSNDSVTPQDLSGYRFVEGIAYEFPPGTILESNGSLVLCADVDAVKAYYGIENAIGNYEGRLDGGGERLTIVNHADREVLSVSYDDQGKWPVAPDGFGHTLVINSVYKDSSEPEYWTKSPELGGSPGRPNFPEAREPEYETVVFVEAGEGWRYAKGIGAFSTPPLAWVEPNFDDASWPEAPSGFGYGDDDDETVLDDMRGGYSSLAVRKTVILTQDDLDAPGDFFLSMWFDDGFCAFVNGQEVARAQCPEELVPDGLADGSHEAREEQLYGVERSVLSAGANTIAIVGYNRRLTDSDFSLRPRFLRRALIEEDVVGEFRGTFNELYRGDGSGNSWVEMYNHGSETIDLSGLRLTDDPDQPSPYVFPQGTMLHPDAFLLLEESDTSLDLSGAKVQLFILDPDGFVLAAAAFDQNFPEGVDPTAFTEARFPDGGRPGWLTDAPTPGAPNEVPRVTDIVINEIFYRPPEEREGEFLELYNRGTEPIDLSGFRFTRGIDLTIPLGTVLGPDEYLVVAQNSEILLEHYGLEGVLQYEGELANSGENVRLVDTLGNLVDEVRYWDGGRWSDWADGRGASLELIDPRQDNDFAAAWGPSDESNKAEWEEHTYIADYTPAGQSELHMLLGERGICRVDDITIATQSFQETEFLPDGVDWRFKKGTEAFSNPPEAWTAEDFDDSSWDVGPSGFGYGDPWYNTVLEDMRRSYTSVAARTTFEVTQEMLDLPGEIFLAVDFDDGICAFLNGVEVAQQNCPDELNHDEIATRTHGPGEDEFFPIPREQLRLGVNHLAVVGFNRSLSSNDFGFVPRVVHLRPGGLGENHIPNPGFEADTRRWTIQGTHVFSQRIEHDQHSGDACLEIVATGKGDSTCNRIETDTSPAMRAQQYTVSLWTKWIRGTSLLILHGEFARGPATWYGTRDVNMSNNSLGYRVRMTVPWNLGTPGAENSQRALLRDLTGSENLGPVIGDVRHSPFSPDEVDRVQVVARVADADGVSSVRVFYQEDSRSNEFDSAAMFDDGQHGDGDPGDGIYGGQIPQFSARQRVRFYIEALDGTDVAGHFPVEAPDETLLYMVEGDVPEQIQVVLSSASRAELNSRPIHSNDLVDGTFVFKNDDVYYNIGLRYRGSPWGRPSRQSYRVRFPKDQRYHRGLKDINISNRDFHDGMWTFLISRNSTRQVPAPPADYQYVGKRVDGTSMRTPGVFETIDRKFLERWYGSDAVDEMICLKALGRLAFNDACSRSGWDEATLVHMDRYSENYRFYWGQAVNQTRDNWQPFMDLTKVMDPNHTSDAEFAEKIDTVMDVEAFLRVMAPRMLMNDGDAVFLGNGHNGYVVWNPETKLWGLLPFDMGFSQVVGSNLTSVRDKQVQRLFRTPHTLRTQYRVCYEYANGYWSELATPWLNALQRTPGGAQLTNPRPTAAANSLRSSSNSLLRRLERYTNSALEITTNGGEDFESDESTIVLEGRAPVQIARMYFSINGAEPELLKPTWSGGSTPIRWTASFELTSMENQIQIVGLDGTDEPIDETGIKVTLPTVPAKTFIRGDTQGDLSVNISDAVAVLAHLFNGRPVRCVDSADVNDDGQIEISDALYIVEYLFLEGPRPPAPFPDAGVDPTEDTLGCGG